MGKIKFVRRDVSTMRVMSITYLYIIYAKHGCLQTAPTYWCNYAQDHVEHVHNPPPHQIRQVLDFQ